MKTTYLVFLILFFTYDTLAQNLEKKKIELQKIYEAGGISKIEYEKNIELLENSNFKEDKKKKSFSLTKKKNIKFFDLLKKDKKLEEVTLEKIDELGEVVKLDNSYFTEGMKKKFKGCNNSLKCKGDKAGQYLFKAFNRSKQYQQQNPGNMIKAMAMYEVFYASKLYEGKEFLNRYNQDEYSDISVLFKFLYNKKLDEEKLSSLIGMNKGRKSMREALGMNLDTPTKEAIKKFWLLGEFLDLGKGIKHEKLPQDLKERQKALQEYKTQISNLKNKLQDDIDEKENEKSFE